jgi:hypothetical protein
VIRSGIDIGEAASLLVKAGADPAYRHVNDLSPIALAISRQDIDSAWKDHIATWDQTPDPRSDGKVSVLRRLIGETKWNSDLNPDPTDKGVYLWTAIRSNPALASNVYNWANEKDLLPKDATGHVTVPKPFAETPAQRVSNPVVQSSHCQDPGCDSLESLQTCPTCRKTFCADHQSGHDCS